MIAIHECGHYLAGGAVGVPWRSMRIRLLTFPQHIALRGGDRWLSPISDHKDFVAAASSVLRTRCHRIAFISGGLLMQTAAFVSVISILVLTGAPRYWLIPIAATLAAMPPVYLAADLAATLFRRKSLGDFSALWKLAPVASISVTILVLAVHCGGFFYALSRPKALAPPPTSVTDHAGARSAPDTVAAHS